MLKVFWHSAQGFDYYEILEEEYKALEKSGLLNKANLIFFNHHYSPGEEDPKGKLPPCIVNDFRITIRLTENKQLLEGDTLELLRQEALVSPDDCCFLYFHIKGMMSAYRLRKDCGAWNWRLYMTYFVIQNYEKCIEKLLQGADTCGVEWRASPRHYSGGFWWATAKYLKTLMPVPQRDGTKDDRILTEFWIGSGNPEAISLFNYYDNMYVRVAKPEEYSIYG